MGICKNSGGGGGGGGAEAQFEAIVIPKIWGLKPPLVYALAPALLLSVLQSPAPTSACL